MSSTNASHAPAAGLTPGLTLVFAIACGLCVANILLDGAVQLCQVLNFRSLCLLGGGFVTLALLLNLTEFRRNALPAAAAAKAAR